MEVGSDIYDDLFPDRVTESVYADVPFTRQSWHGRMRACRGTLASMDGETFDAWERAHLEHMNACPERFTVRHLICYSRFTVE